MALNRKGFPLGVGAPAPDWSQPSSLAVLAVGRCVVTGRRSGLGGKFFQVLFQHSFVALRTEAVRELYVRSRGEIVLHLVPVILSVTDFLAVTANRQQPF